MLAAVSPLVRNIKDESGQGGEMERFSILDDEFGAGDGSNFLDTGDFDDLFVGIYDGDLLPDLEMEYPEILAELSVTDVGREEADQISIINKLDDVCNDGNNYIKTDRIEEDDHHKQLSAGSGLTSVSSGVGEQEIISRRDDDDLTKSTTTAKEAGKSRKSSSSRSSSSGQSKNSQGKRKMKVDWTPELHRRFVQAVEQLGVDKAVPSRILEVMGVDCLTRHNIASHLQKYRSHRKHLLAREAEAASWNQRWQMYHGPPAVGSINRGNIGKRPLDHGTNPWFVPTMGFPSITSPVVPPSPLAALVPPPVHHLVRPSLHVWGHPPIDQQSLVHMTWPRHLPHSPPPPLAQPVSARPILPDPSFWHHPHPQVPSAPTPGTPCFPQALAPTTRQITLPPAVLGVPPAPPPHAVYKADPGINGSAPQHPPLDIYPSKESIDAAFGDVLAKPWLPLPLGLKPPSHDGVMAKLQRHGVPNIPISPAH